MGERRVEVEWLDSVSWSGWRSRKDAESKATIGELRHRSCGYLVADNDDGMMLALSVSAYDDDQPGDGGCADVLMIPRAVILNVTELRVRGSSETRRRNQRDEEGAGVLPDQQGTSR